MFWFGLIIANLAVSDNERGEQLSREPPQSPQQILRQYPALRCTGRLHQPHREPSPIFLSVKTTVGKFSVMVGLVPRIMLKLAGTAFTAKS